MIDDSRISRYLDDLPALFRQEAVGARADFLGRFLLAFEHVLTGVGDPGHPGLEEILEGIVDGDKILLGGAHRYFTPISEEAGEQVPSEFLEWLAGWVALTLRDDWSEQERRRLLAEIVPSYRRRGTPEGLKQVLAAFTGVHISAVTLLETPFAVGVTSVVGRDVALGGGQPHYFIVRVQLPGASDVERKRKALRTIIDQEKPAHTCYDLYIQIPTLQVGVTSTVGQDTALGVPVGTS